MFLLPIMHHQQKCLDNKTKKSLRDETHFTFTIISFEERKVMFMKLLLFQSSDLKDF
jgi:hypothetical protein